MAITPTILVGVTPALVRVMPSALRVDGPVVSMARLLSTAVRVYAYR